MVLEAESWGRDGMSVRVEGSWLAGGWSDRR